MKQELAKEGRLPWFNTARYALYRWRGWTRHAFWDTETIFADLLIWAISATFVLHWFVPNEDVAYQIFVGM